MNTGTISARYASALLKFSAESGHEKLVYRQVKTLAGSMSALPQHRNLLDNPMSVSDSQKFSLLSSALGDEKMADELQSFIRLVMKKRRTKYLRFMLLSFIRQYRDSHNIKESRLITAVPDTELEKKISDIIRERKGDSVLFEHRVDPSIIGGFIFEIDGLRLDASTAAQLKSVRKQFIEKNRRIV